MAYRIITHGNCSDGFASAFIFKKYWKYLVPELTQEDIDSAELLGLQPRDLQSGEFTFTEKDIVLDLPKPNTKIYYWCDHHSSNKTNELNEREHWKVAPSNAGYLLSLAVKNGLELTPNLKSFLTQADIMDSADYTRAMIQESFYDDVSENPSDLLKMHMIGSMFHTRDRLFNEEVFRTLIDVSEGETPLDSKSLWALRPAMYHRSQLCGFREWRAVVDEYLTYDEDAKCTIQDDRLATMKRGVIDRFYSIMKFDQTSYTFNIRESRDGETARLGIGSNIFHKDRCKVDIGKLCKATADKFGDGAGGGHFYVGGATISAQHYNDAKKYVLDSLKEGKVL